MSLLIPYIQICCAEYGRSGAGACVTHAVGSCPHAVATMVMTFHYLSLNENV